jgi:D-cysteine desulfhydrase
VVPVGSGGTLAGLVVGVKEAGLNIPVIGLAVCDDTPTFVKIVDDIAAELHKDYGYTQISNKDYQVIDTFKGIGYAKSTPEELDLLTKTASQDAVLFDPVYTIKAWRGFINLAKTSKSLGDRPLFIHTGGIYGVMAEGEVIQTHCKD